MRKEKTAKPQNSTRPVDTELRDGQIQMGMSFTSSTDFEKELKTAVRCASRRCSTSKKKLCFNKSNRTTQEPKSYKNGHGRNVTRMATPTKTRWATFVPFDKNQNNPRIPPVNCLMSITWWVDQAAKSIVVQHEKDQSTNN